MYIVPENLPSPIGLRLSELELQVTLQLNSLIILLTSFLLLGMALFIGLFQLHGQTTRHLLALLVLNCVISALLVSMRESWLNSQEAVMWLSLQMLQGPFLYAYVRSLVSQPIVMTPVQLLHFLPASLFAVLWLIQIQYPNLLSLPCPQASLCSAQYESRFVHRLAAWVSIFLYGYYALRLLPAYIHTIKNHYSALHGLKLTWLRWLIWCFIAITLVAALLDGLRYSGIPLWLYGGVLQAWGPIMLMFFIAGFSIRQRNINQQMGLDNLSVLHQSSEQASAGNKQQAPEQHAQTKYQSSGLMQEQAQQLWLELGRLMESEHLYLKHGLKIADVADALSIPSNYVSQAINSEGQCSFYDWVNEYRLKHALTLLAQPTLKVVDIALASGFSSQSSFYGNFKQRFNMTPRQYRLAQ